MKQFDTVICGAGIAGIATAYYLAVKHGRSDILLVDKLLPMSFTTSASGENYRDYWPQQCMRSMSTHSLNLMDELIAEHGDVFALRDFGYQFVSQSVGTDIFGATPADASVGLSRCVDPAAIQQQWPHLSEDIAQTVNITRAGAIDVFALGSLLLRQARAAGVSFQQLEISSIESSSSGRYALRGSDEQIEADHLILAAGPFTGELARQLGVDLPLEEIVQRKFVIPDPIGVIPRDMPFTISADSQYLDWNEQEKDIISGDNSYRWLLNEFPPGLHIKPEGRGQIKLGWAFNRQAGLPRWNVPVDEDFPNIVVRGASRFVPGLRAYVDKLPTPVVQYAGYYSRTPENWPLIGPLPLENLYTVAGLSGFGTMTACAAGELCAQHMSGHSLPQYQRNFHPNRYEDEPMVAEMAALGSDGQL